MEALGVLKIWRSAGGGADARSDVSDARGTVYITDDEETDDEDELFDLVFSSPNFRDAIVKGGGEASRKDIEIVDSPRDILLGRIDFSNSKPMSPPVTILRSAQKFKVKFVLGFGKSSKCEKAEANGEQKGSPLNQLRKSSSNSSSAKCSVAEFSVDDRLRSDIQKGRSEFETPPREKYVPKYLKLIKPFYIKVSKKVKLTTDSVTPSPSPATAPPRKLSEGNRLGSFKMVPRNLRKSRSASAAAGVDLPSSVHRKNDSLVQQYDGIQSAILHCKKSYSSSSEEFSQLFQSSTDPPHENLKTGGRNSGEGQNRCSI